MVRYRGVPGQIVAIDTERAGRMAARSGIDVVFAVRVGDGIATGSLVASASAESLDERFDHCVLVRRERSAAVRVPRVRRPDRRAPARRPAVELPPRAKVFCRSYSVAFRVAVRSKPMAEAIH